MDGSWNNGGAVVSLIGPKVYPGVNSACNTSNGVYGYTCQACSYYQVMGTPGTVDRYGSAYTGDDAGVRLATYIPKGQLISGEWCEDGFFNLMIL